MHGHPEEAVGRGCDATPTPSRSQPGGDASGTARGNVQHEATCGQPGSAPCVYACTRARARAGECSPRQGACARPRPRERHLSWPAHDHADHRRSDTDTHLIDHALRAQRVQVVSHRWDTRGRWSRRVPHFCTAALLFARPAGRRPSLSAPPCFASDRAASPPMRPLDSLHILLVR